VEPLLIIVRLGDDAAHCGRDRGTSSTNRLNEETSKGRASDQNKKREGGKDAEGK
jgi:hypothetical protein